MISVIIPTMWKAEHLKKMLPMLNSHPLIGEIILIDNDMSKTDHELLKQISKLVYWTFDEGNIFVNPAWNFGASIAKYDKLFILNDDCLINLKCLENIYNFVTPKIGMLGYSFLSYCTYTIDAFETLCSSGFGSEISFEIIDPGKFPDRSGMPHPFFGSAFFIHKDNYHNIPSDFKIYYGDLFNYIQNLKNGCNNYTIEDGLVMSQYSSTVSTISKDLIIQESKILKDVFASHGLKNIRYSLKNMDDEDKT
jgi:hypothetical protein